MKIGKIDMNLRVESLRISQTLLKIFIFYFLLILPLIAIPQEIKNRVNNNKIRKPTDALPILSKSKSKKPNLRNQPPKMMGADPSEPITMEFSLEWTNYKAHLVNESGPLEIIMNGNISSNNPEIWALSCVQPTTGIPPKLYFVEDVLGRSGTAHGSDLALNFEISINGGSFEPMIILPDNSLSYLFPVGNNSFQIRIRGNLPYHQADGYYYLQLSQSLIPQL